VRAATILRRGIFHVRFQCEIFYTLRAVVSSIDDRVPLLPTRVLLKITGPALLAVSVKFNAIPKGACRMRYCLILGILFCGIAHAGPRCNPGEYSPTVNWQVAVASDQSIVSILWCNDSDSLQFWATGWNPQQSPVNSCAGSAQASTVNLLAVFWDNCLASGGSLTAPQQTAVNRLVALWMPKLESPAVEPVYQYDGGGTLVGGAQGTIAAHTPCLGKVVASVNGEYYYNVAGQHYAEGGTIPAHMAALCQLMTPPATGWSQ
jgi:hypothetical protein